MKAKVEVEYHPTLSEDERALLILSEGLPIKPTPENMALWRNARFCPACAGPVDMGLWLICGKCVDGAQKLEFNAANRGGPWGVFYVWERAFYEEKRKAKGLA